jgi:hypothetical protein
MHCAFYDDASLLICGGVDGCYIMQLKINNEYNAVQRTALDPTGRTTHITLENGYQLSEGLKWCKGLRVDRRN